MGSGTSSLTTVVRACEILDVLWERDGAGPTEVAEAIGLPTSTAYEYLRALAETKFVTARNGEYAVSSYMLTMGGKLRHRNQLFQVAKEEMRRAAAATDELIGLTIEDNGMAVILHQEEGSRALNLGTYLGAATPLHTNAAGKAILAFLPDAERDRILAENGLARRTEQTITDESTLRAELDRIRTHESAVDWDEQVLGMGMAAVPLVVSGEVLGSVCIVTPTGRLQDDSYQEHLLGHLRELAQTITINYQYGR